MGTLLDLKNFQWVSIWIHVCKALVNCMCNKLKQLSESTLKTFVEEEDIMDEKKNHDFLGVLKNRFY